MASADIQRQPGVPKRAFKPIVEPVTGKRKAVDTIFDPSQHLAFKGPPDVIQMEDLGYAKETGISPCLLYTSPSPRD